MEAARTEATTGRLFLLQMVHGHCVTIVQFALPSKPNLGNLSWNLGGIQLHICCSMKDWRSEWLIYSDIIAHLTCLKVFCSWFCGTLSSESINFLTDSATSILFTSRPCI